MFKIAKFLFAKKTEKLKKIQKQIFKNTTSMDTKEYNQKLKSHGISQIDSKFSGRIDKDGVLMTHENKVLDKTVGKQVIMNPEYNPDTDDTFYCTSLIPGAENRTYHYTKDYLIKQGKDKFMDISKLDDEISKIRTKISTDLKSSDPKTKILALIVALVDKGYFRIGNEESEKNGVYGLHNLLVKHVSFKNGKMHFKYIGKDEIKQHQIISDHRLQSIVKDLIKNKKQNDYIFTIPYNGGYRNIKSTEVNEYLHDDLASPVSIHKFRAYHATRMAQKAFEKINYDKDDKKSRSNQIMDQFRDALKKISRKMGHTNIGTTIKHYVDTNVLVDFFKKHKLPLPKTVKNNI